MSIVKEIARCEDPTPREGEPYYPGMKMSEKKLEMMVRNYRWRWKTGQVETVYSEDDLKYRYIMDDDHIFQAGLRRCRMARISGAVTMLTGIAVCAATYFGVEYLRDIGRAPQAFTMPELVGYTLGPLITRVGQVLLMSPAAGFIEGQARLAWRKHPGPF